MIQNALERKEKRYHITTNANVKIPEPVITKEITDNKNITDENYNLRRRHKKFSSNEVMVIDDFS
jgi:hypothetical protein